MAINMYSDKENISEFTLRLLNPAFAWLARRYPERFGPPADAGPHPSAMQTEKNWFYNTIFPRFLQRISVDQDAVELLRETAKGSTIVYVAKRMGHLEYNYFNELFLKENLPLVAYNNALTLRRWMRWDDYWKTIFFQEAEISKWGRTLDPMTEGALPKMISEGKSILIKLPPSQLIDESLFFTGPLASLRAIIEAQRQSERPICIVPLEFLWSRHPKRQHKSLLDILFGEKESPGMMRKTVLFWRNYKSSAQAAVGRPINLREFISSGNGSTDDEIAERLRTSLLKILKAQRETITGPTIKPRGWFIAQVLGDDDLDTAICKLAAERGKKADDFRGLAKRYIKEIAADVDYTYVELMNRLLGGTLRKIYENFDVDTKGLKRAKELYAEGPVIFVPNHKSHVDYLVLSHVLYQNSMTIPHIAAGMNLGFWPLGKIFRRCGAYFIRRQFRDNPVYRLVLEAYLKVLLKEGYSQEFFIEGGRSRTGKLRPPKTGMISMLGMAAANAGLPRLNFIPVALTYDRVIEQRSLISESEGGAKESERPSHLLRLPKYLKKRHRGHGSIYIRFGEPVAMDCSRGGGAPTGAIAREICHEINRHAVLTPAGLAAAALLAPARCGVAFGEFERCAWLIFDCLKHKGIEFSSRFDNPLSEILKGALSKLSSSRLISIQSSAIEPYIAIDESKRMPLAFFKNGMVHFMLTIGSVCSLVLARHRRGLPLSRAAIIPDFEKFRDILGHEFSFATRMASGEHIDRALSFLIEKDAIHMDALDIIPIADGMWMIENLHLIIRPYIETLYIATMHINGCPSGEIEEKNLVDGMMQTGKDLHLLGRIRYREAINKFDLGNTLRNLKVRDVISVKEAGDARRRQKIYIIPTEKDAAYTLQVALQEVL